MTDLCKFKDPFDDEIGPLIRKVLKLWQRIGHKHLGGLGLTISQLEIMGAIVALKCEDKEVTQIALSHETNIDPMTTSTILRNLQKKGLITRKESETDTRARAVELTEAGEKILIEAGEKINILYKKLGSDRMDKKRVKIKLTALYRKLNNLYNELQ